MYLNSAFESKHPVYNRIEQSQVIKICENTIGICRAFNWNILYVGFWLIGFWLLGFWQIDWLLADWLLAAWLLVHWLLTDWLLVHWLLTAWLLADWLLTVWQFTGQPYRVLDSEIKLKMSENKYKIPTLRSWINVHARLFFLWFFPSLHALITYARFYFFPEIWQTALLSKHNLHSNWLDLN